MKPGLLSVAIVFLLATSSSAFQQAVEVEPKEALRHLDLPADIPSRFTEKQAIRVTKEGREIALSMVYVDSESTDFIHLHTETGFDRSSHAARRGAAKAYCNTTISDYTKRGYRLVSTEPSGLVQNFDAFDFANEMRVTLTFEDQEGGLRYAKLRIFFTKLGFVAVSHSDDLERLEEVQAFINQLKPKEG